MRLVRLSLTLRAAWSSEVVECANDGRTVSNNFGVNGSKSLGQIVKNSSIQWRAVNCISSSYISHTLMNGTTFITEERYENADDF